MKIMFFCKTWVQRSSLLTKNSTYTYIFYHQERSMESRIHPTSVGYGITLLSGRPFFEHKMCLFTKTGNLWKLCFLQNLCSKMLPPDQEYYHTNKTFTIREHLWNLCFTIKVLDKVYPFWEKDIFWPQDVPLYENWELMKIVFLQNLGSKMLPPDQEYYHTHKNIYHQGTSMEPRLYHTSDI